MLRPEMGRRLAAALAALLLAPAAAHAGTLGLAEVHAGDGSLLARAGTGAFRYPADGYALTIGSARATPSSVELRDVSILGGRVVISRLVVPAHGLAGARVDGLTIDGRPRAARPNAIVPLGGRSYLVLLQQAVSLTKGGARTGLVGLRVYVDDDTSGVVPGTQLLVGLARAARQTATDASPSAWGMLGVEQVRAATAGVIAWDNPFAAVGDGSIGARAVAIAERYLGIPYLWGGASPETGFDCSGLTMYVYSQLGISLMHYTGSQFGEGAHVPRDELRPGDLVFFHPGPAGPSHEGMYIGGGQFIHAPQTGDVVKISTLADPRYALGYAGAVRPY